MLLVCGDGAIISRHMNSWMPSAGTQMYGTGKNTTSHTISISLPPPLCWGLGSQVTSCRTDYPKASRNRMPSGLQHSTATVLPRGTVLSFRRTDILFHGYYKLSGINPGLGHVTPPKNTQSSMRSYAWLSDLLDKPNSYIRLSLIWPLSDS